MLAALIEDSTKAAPPGAPGPPASRRGPDQRRQRQPERIEPRVGPHDLGDVLGRRRPAADDARGRASATPQLRRSPTRNRRARFKGKWAAMAITEPEAGSDSAAIRTTAVLDGDEYVLNGEKIYVTSGERADLVVVWATLDPKQGRAAIKSFVVRAVQSGPEARPARAQARDPGLRHRRLHPRRLPGRRRTTFSAAPRSTRRRASPERCGRSTTPDRSSPRWPVGVGRACLERTTDASRRGRGRGRSRPTGPFAERRRGRAARPRSRLRGRAPADDARPPGWPTTASPTRFRRRWRRRRRAAPPSTSRSAASPCAAPSAYSEDELLEKWARDAKILDIFEGTQQIQLLVIARQLLGLGSAELK